MSKLLVSLGVLCCLSGCVTMNARFQLEDGKWAEIRSVRPMFTTADFSMNVQKNDSLVVGYGEKTEQAQLAAAVNQMNSVFEKLLPILLKAAATGAGIP